MPTPEEIPTLPPSPPAEAEASSSRASFTSCPPDEEREYHAPREERIADSWSRREGDRHPDQPGENAHTTTQAPTPEPEEQPAERIAVARAVSHEKGEDIEDAGIEVDPPSTVGSPDAPSDGEARLSQSMSGAVISSSDAPIYLTLPLEPKRVRTAAEDLATSTNSCPSTSTRPPPPSSAPVPSSVEPSNPTDKSMTYKSSSKTSTCPNPSFVATCASKV